MIIDTDMVADYLLTKHNITSREADHIYNMIVNEPVGQLHYLRWRLLLKVEELHTVLATMDVTIMKDVHTDQQKQAVKEFKEALEMLEGAEQILGN